MRIGMVGLGRMGANMARRLMDAGHEVVAYDANKSSVDALVAAGAQAAYTLEELVAKLPNPRAVWLMVPAAVVENVLDQLARLLAQDDIVVDGGNSDYRLAIARARRFAASGVHFLDVGTSGGVWGLERGYCLMIGGDRAAAQRLEPIFATLAPTPIPAASGAGETKGYLYCGAPGAGHFVKMVHNAIEYAVMAAYAEGFNLLKQAGRGREDRPADAETTPLAELEAYQYDFDVAAIADLWRNGSVIRSWLLDLTAAALQEDAQLEGFSGHVSDSGEGRWALKAAIDLGVPMPSLSSALFARFSSRDEDAYANRLLSALRKQFGGHQEKKK
jgi:6-phosphogluconate dehydrogenase (decarboxylating) (EC 1.1.1.44)